MVSWDNEEFFKWTFSKIIKIWDCFQIFESFCPFLSLSIITVQQNFLSLAEGLLDSSPATKIILNIFFHCEIWKRFF